MKECLYNIVKEVEELYDASRMFTPYKVLEKLNQEYNQDHYDYGGRYENLTEEEEEELALKGRIALNDLEDLECFIGSLWKFNNFISHEELKARLEEFENLKDLENMYPLIEETKDLAASIQTEFNKLVNGIL